MVFYFTGTGNSFWVAKKLGEYFNEKIVAISDELNNPDNSFKYELADNEKVFFVFPVHSWGPAALISRFISKIYFEGYNNNEVYSVCTCGDNCAYTDRILKKTLQKKSIKLTKTLSIQMPNNYILMSGFNTDSEDIEKQKLENAPVLLHDIIDNIQQHKEEAIYTIGTKPFLKSKIIYPLFKKFALGKNSFYVKDNCTSCGLCEEVCPTKTIHLENGKPEWSNTCVQCVACIHRCPVNAIEYGKVSQSKGRYFHPDLK